MDKQTIQISLTNNEKSLLKTILYYDVFKHPLTLEELSNSFDKRDNLSIETVLGNLENHKFISSKKGYYFLSGEDQMVEERHKDEVHLAKYLRIARFMSYIIASCPFVRGVSLSGSISKGRIYDSADIDFFIITEKGSLYISRTLLTLFKKIFLFNSYKYFCLNYFVDTESLEFKERNRYAATETITLIPTYNDALFDKLLEANKWVGVLFPGFVRKDNKHMIPDRIRPLKTIVELLLRNKIGNWVDDLLMNLTDKYRRKKFAHMSQQHFDHSFSSIKSVSRHHPDDYQNNAMTKFLKKVEELEKKNGMDLIDGEEF